MSKALKCDRCKCCFDPYSIKEPSHFTTIEELFVQNGKDLENNKAGYMDKQIHLCPVCSKQFADFMNNDNFVARDMYEELLNRFSDLETEHRELLEEDRSFYNCTLPEIKEKIMEDINSATDEECRNMLNRLFRYILFGTEYSNSRILVRDIDSTNKAVKWTKFSKKDSKH